MGHQDPWTWWGFTSWLVVCLVRVSSSKEERVIVSPLSLLIGHIHTIPKEGYAHNPVTSRSPRLPNTILTWLSYSKQQFVVAAQISTPEQLFLHTSCREWSHLTGTILSLKLLYIWMSLYICIWVRLPSDNRGVWSPGAGAPGPNVGCSESNFDALKQQHMLLISEPSLHTSVCYLLILGTRTENFSEVHRQGFKNKARQVLCIWVLGLYVCYAPCMCLVPEAIWRGRGVTWN